MNKNSKRVAVAGLTALVGIVAWLTLPYQPAYQEWQCKESSLDKLRALQARLPENPVLFYYLGLRYMEAHRTDEAIPVLIRGVAFDPDSARLRDALARALLSEGKTHETYLVIRQYFETHPGNPDASLMMARFYLTTQTFGPASTLLKEATRKFPKNGELWSLLAIAQHRLNDAVGAADAAAEAVRLQPKDSKAWFLEAQIFKRTNRPEARAAYERAQQLAPGDSAIQADFADYLARRADYSAAETLARKVLREHPDDLRASGALGLALAARNDPVAAPLLSKGLQNDPLDIEIIRTLQRLATRAGRTSEAEHMTRRALHTLQTLQAERDLNTKLELHPEDTAALGSMAALMGRRGEYFRCMQYHARALHQLVDAPASLLAAANDLEAGGFPQIARHLAEQARENSKTTTERTNADGFLQHRRAQ